MEGVLAHLTTLLREDRAEHTTSPSQGHMDESIACASPGEGAVKGAAVTALETGDSSGGEHGVESIVPTEGWACSKCTYENPTSRRKCELCEAPRPRKHAKREKPLPSSPPSSPSSSLEGSGSMVKAETISDFDSDEAGRNRRVGSKKRPRPGREKAFQGGGRPTCAAGRARSRYGVDSEEEADEAWMVDSDASDGSNEGNIGSHHRLRKGDCGISGRRKRKTGGNRTLLNGGKGSYRDGGGSSRRGKKESDPSVRRSGRRKRGESDGRDGVFSIGVDSDSGEGIEGGKEDRESQNQSDGSALSSEEAEWSGNNIDGDDRNDDDDSDDFAIVPRRQRRANGIGKVGGGGSGIEAFLSTGKGKGKKKRGSEDHEEEGQRTNTKFSSVSRVSGLGRSRESGARRGGKGGSVGHVVGSGGGGGGISKKAKDPRKLVVFAHHKARRTRNDARRAPFLISVSRYLILFEIRGRVRDS